MIPVRMTAALLSAALLSACNFQADTQAATNKTAAKTPSENPAKSPAKSSTPTGNEEMAKAAPAASGIYAMKAQSLAGKEIDLASYSGKVSLVVNVASECGYTRQYSGLQKLHEELSGKGFQVLGFPCNDFGGQEPGTPEQIRSFCDERYKVTFPMFAKVKIKGEPAPLYKSLIDSTGSTPSWNFCKYLIGKDGKVIGFYSSGTSPNDAALRTAIEKAL